MSMQKKTEQLERERVRLAGCAADRTKKPVEGPVKRMDPFREKTDDTEGGGPLKTDPGREKTAAERQHAAGKYTARERIGLFMDPGSFHEIGLFARHQCMDFGMDKKEIPADGVVTGYGRVDGRKVFVYAQDFTAYGGSIGKMQAMKICRVLDLAAEAGAPVIGINDSGGARVQEGVDALAGIGEIFRRLVDNSGRIPQISMIMGPCAGGAAYAPAMTDLVVMRKGQGLMFCTGPGVIRDVTGEAVDAQALGGAKMHAERSGEADLAAETEEEAFALVRQVLGYLPSSCMEKPPRRAYGKKAGSGENAQLKPELEMIEPDDTELRPMLETIVPDESRKPYDMLDVIAQIADRESFLELQPLFADNLITGFARIGGRPVGIVASQPYVMAGCLDLDASDKGARFVELCSSFHIPLISLVDVPGFLPGVDQEQRGLLRHGARMLSAFAAAKVPRITVILRKAYGGAYMAMCSREMGADLVFAWPGAEIAVMGAESAVNLLYSREIAKAEDPEAARAELVEKYREKFSTPYFAAARGYIDEIIRPQETRERIIEALDIFAEAYKGGMTGK